MQRINYELHDLQAFVAVAERHSFRQAATDLFLSQPALSRRIEKLEEALGVKLFERTTRRVQLTNVGQAFLVNVRDALNGLEDAVLGVADLAAHRTGTVTFACVPSAVWHFLPDVLNLVLTGEADFGISFTGAENPEIHFQPIHVESYVLAMRRDHPLAKRRKLNWRDTVDERYISVAKSSGNRSVLDAALSGVEKHPWISCEINHVSGVLALVESGLGVAAVPGLSIPREAHSTVIGVPLVNPTVNRTLGLISRHQHAMPPASRTLFDMLVAGIGKPGRRAAR